MIKFLNMKRRFSTVAQVASQSFGWADYYSSISPNPETISSRIDLTDEMHYIKDSSFKSLGPSSQSGAAIYFSADKQLLVEYSLFANCKTNDKHGGAIYVSNGECVVAYTCANGCSAGTATGQFSCQQVSSVSTQSDLKQNAIIDSSVAYCDSAPNGGYNAFRMVYGKITVSTVNVSRNTIYQFAAIEVRPTNNNLNTASNDANNADCSITYCTVSNNNARYNNIIWMSFPDTFNPTHFMTHCNIIENSQVNNNIGLIFTNGITTSNINYCCILGNKCGKLFQAWDSTANMNINNCTIDNITGVSETTGMRTQSSFIYGINHYAATGYCYASFDVIGSLELKQIPKQTPDSTPMKTPIQTPKWTPDFTPKWTPMKTPDFTPIQTQKAAHTVAMKHAIMNYGLILFPSAAYFLATYDLY